MFCKLQCNCKLNHFFPVPGSSLLLNSQQPSAMTMNTQPYPLLQPRQLIQQQPSPVMYSLPTAPLLPHPHRSQQTLMYVQQPPQQHTPLPTAPHLPHPHHSQQTLMYVQQPPQQHTQFVSAQPLLQQPVMPLLQAPPSSSLVHVPAFSQSVPELQPSMTAVLPTAQPKMASFVPVAQPGMHQVLLPSPGGGMVQGVTPTYVQGGGVASQQYVLVQRQ